MRRSPGVALSARGAFGAARYGTTRRSEGPLLRPSVSSAVTT